MSNSRNRIFSIILALLLCVGLGTPVFGADDVKAATIRLTKTEGEGVFVTTNAGKAAKITENMRVFNGFKVRTDKKSFAYLSLDDTKAVKLDKNTKVRIKKNGGHHQVFVDTGKLFFNVKEKLKPTESMEIKASNMSMGIRGTSGVVSTAYCRDAKGVISESRTKVLILDGSTYVEITDPKTGEIKSCTLKSGTRMDIIDYPKDKTGEVIFDEIDDDDLPDFAEDEILDDEDLEERVKEGSGISSEDIEENRASADAAEEALEKLLEQEEEAAENLAKSQSNVVSEASKDDGSGVDEDADAKTEGDADAKTEGDADAKTDAKTEGDADAKTDAKS